MLRRTFLVALALLCTGAETRSAPRFRIARSPRCVWLRDHLVFPLKDSRIEGGALRCSYGVTAPKDVGPETAARFVIRQDGKDMAKVEAKVPVTAGANEVELEVAAPGELNGCMPYELIARIGDAEANVKASPLCPD